MSETSWEPGREQELTALGKGWKLSVCNRHVWKAFAEFVQTVMPDPIRAVANVIEQVASADAAVLRGLFAKDKEAKDAKRNEVSLADKYVQMAETITNVAIMKAAARMSFGSYEMLDLLRWPDAQCKMLFLLLRKHQPDISEDTADEILNEIGHLEGFKKLFVTACGQVPPPQKKTDTNTSPLPPNGQSTGGKQTSTSHEPTTKLHAS